MSLLAHTGAHIISCNEGRNFVTLLQAVGGYQYAGATTGFLANNPVLVREDIHVDGFETRPMCDAVGTSPARGATIVDFELGGQPHTHIATHLNAHIQLAGSTPRDLPRVKEAVRHMQRLEALVNEKRAQGRKVTVAGDFNWSWSRDDSHDWTYSPEAVFGRLGMTTNNDDPSNPAGGTLGSRDIDYIAFDPAEFAIRSQSLVEGEHSDHAWPLVNLIPA